MNVPLLSEMNLECNTTHHSPLMKLSTVPSVDEDDEVSSIATDSYILIILKLSFRIFLAGRTMNTWSTERNCLKIDMTVSVFFECLCE